VKKILIALFMGIFLVDCAPPVTPGIPFSTTPLTNTPAVTSTPYAGTGTLWISPAVPDLLREVVRNLKIPIVTDSAGATVKLDIQSGIEGSGSQWIYALVAPFPTVADGVTSDELHQAWKGSLSGAISGTPLWMTESTLAAFTELWGAPASGSVQTAPADQLLNNTWKSLP
jgi:hypothetical protein